MAIRIFKILLLAIIGFSALLALVGTWAVTTTIGGRELSSLVNTIEPRVSTDIRGGNLLSGIEAGHITWTDEFLTVTADNVTSEWEPKCFLKRQLCANSIDVETLTLKMRSSTPGPRTDSIIIPEIKLPINLAANDLKVGKLIIDYDEDAELVEIENIKLVASSKGQLVDVKSLSARFKNIIASASGEVELNEQISVSLIQSTILEDLYEDHDLVLKGGVNGPLDNLRMSGTSRDFIDATYIANVDILAPNIPSKARIKWQEAGWPIEDHLLAKSTDGELYLEGDIKSYAFNLNSLASGRDLPPASVKLDGDLTFFGVVSNNVNVETLNGSISGEASLDWTDWKNKIDWTSKLSFSDIDPSEYNADVTGNLAGTVFASGSFNRDNTWKLDLKPAVVQGTLNDQAIHAHAVLLRSGKEKWNIDSLRLISRDNHFELSGTVDDIWAIEGDLNLSKLQQLLPEASGSILGNVTLSGPALEPIVDFNLHSKELIWMQDSAEDLALSGRIDNLLNNKSEVKLDAKKFIVDDRKVGALNVVFKGSKQLHNIVLNAESINDSKASVSIDGALLENLDWKGTFFASTLNLPGHDLKLEKATALSFDKSSNILKVAPHCWSNSESKVCLNNTLSASKNGRAELTVSPYAIDQINEFMPERISLKGQANADIQLDWGPEIENGFRAIVNAELNDGSVQIKSEEEKDLVLSYKRVEIATYLDSSDMRTNITVDSENLGRADVSFSINPAVKPLSFTRGTLKLSDFDLRFLQSFLPDIETISGTVSADGKITGAVMDPAFIGDITLSEPIVKSEQLPFQITGGKVSAAIAGRKATLSGTVKSGNGDVNLFGEADWEDLTAWSFVVNAQGDALVINQKPLLESVVAPNLVVSIRPNQINVGGNIKIVAAAINIKKIPEGATSLSPDIVLAEQAGDDALTEPKWKLASDVTIILGNAVRLSGYGMRAQLKGDFRVVKTDDKPLLLFGEIDIPTGIYKSYGQDLKVVDGQVILVGPVNLSTLNIDAFREVDDVTAGLHISGTIETPLVTLYSDPYLEHERILAYIVLGRDIAAGDNNDSNILATAALSMGISNGRGLATDIAEAFGIREFNIEASGRGEDTQVLLSGRLSERLLVRYGVGVFTPVNTLYLRYDLTKKLYLETAQGIERAADLIYSFEF